MDNLDNRLQNITLNANESQNNDGDKWGMPLKDLYRLGMTFYKGINGGILPIDVGATEKFCCIFR